MPLILGTNSIKDTGYDVANSLRFNSGSSDYLNRTATSGNQRTFTFSCWFKLCDTATQYLGSQSSGSNSYMAIYIQSSEVRVYDQNNSNQTLYFRTNRLLRDFSAWYHLMVAVDTTQSTESNRVKIYINGVQETSFASSTYPSQNTDTNINHNGTVFQIGRYDYTGIGSPTHYLNSYLAETVLVDGSQLDQTSFGEFDSDSGIWKPKDVSGLTFGTNGFYLDFEDSSALGNDVSGNNNDFTVNNLTAIDQSTDTCTNNFATLNPLFATQDSGTMSEGNTIYTASANAWGGSGSTIGLSQGKWYFEIQLNNNAGGHFFGVIDETANVNNNPHQRTGSTFFYSAGEMYRDGSSISSGHGTFGASDIGGVALNLDDNEITIYKNGSAIVTDFALSTTKNTLFVWVMGYNSGSDLVKVNFGGSPPFTISSGNADGNGYGNFEYSVPANHYAINSKNLAEYG